MWGQKKRQCVCDLLMDTFAIDSFSANYKQARPAIVVPILKAFAHLQRDLQVS